MQSASATARRLHRESVPASTAPTALPGTGVSRLPKNSATVWLQATLRPASRAPKINMTAQRARYAPARVNRFASLSAPMTRRSAQTMRSVPSSVSLARATATRPATFSMAKTAVPLPTNASSRRTARKLACPMHAAPADARVTLTAPMATGAIVPRTPAIAVPPAMRAHSIPAKAINGPAKPDLRVSLEAPPARSAPRNAPASPAPVEQVSPAPTLATPARSVWRPATPKPAIPAQTTSSPARPDIGAPAPAQPRRPVSAPARSTPTPAKTGPPAASSPADSASASGPDSARMTRSTPVAPRCER